MWWLLRRAACYVMLTLAALPGSNRKNRICNVVCCWHRNAIKLASNTSPNQLPGPDDYLPILAAGDHLVACGTPGGGRYHLAAERGRAW